MRHLINEQQLVPFWKPHTIGEKLIKSAAVKMMEIRREPEYSKQLNSVPLSAKITKHRISKLAQNVREQVIASIKSSEHFALHLDETADVRNDFQLVVYVPY